MALERLKDFPRAILWPHDTPLEPQHNLARELGVESFLIKRDDCNGLAFGGNKVRQMEYYLGDAIAKEADTLLITGAVQSNFVRTAAAACAKYGLQCHVQLENRVAKNSENYANSGNVLLDHLLGAIVHAYPEGEDEEGADRNLEDIADRLRSKGRNPYVVHLHPSHPPFGALGYVDAARELVEQIARLEREPDIIFSPSGSGSTHGGLLYGLRALGCN
ncbi:MAG: pyridoxal-phosphate dependent enzyme, partial [Pseudomonadota bacterium]